MLTPSGWLSLIVSLVALAAGRILVLAEVVILGAVGVLLVAASLLAVWGFCPKTRIRRHHPSSVVSVEEGTDVSIEFEKRLWLPVKLPMHVQDTLKHYRPRAEGDGELRNGSKSRSEDYERFTVSFNLSGKSKSAAYSFSPARRGIVSFGPLAVRASDPFGIARRKWKDATATEILVLPPIEDVIPPQLSLLAKSQEEVCSIWQGSPTGDFLTLREYVHGDDMRHVHWKSSARTGRFMIRQSEHRRESGALLLLDTRAEAAGEQDFEKMVAAAASLCLACRRHRMQLHLATPHAEPLLVRDDASLEEALRMLALVPQSAEPQRAQNFTGHRAVVVLTGDQMDDFADGEGFSDDEGFSDGFQEVGIDSMAGLRVCFGEQPSAASGMWVPPGAKFSDVWNGYFWKSHLSYAETQPAGIMR